MQSTSVFMFSQVCLCLIERTIGVWTSVKVLYHKRERENGHLFQFKLCVTMVFRFAQRIPSDRCRWLSNDLSLWKNSDTRSPALRREERLHGLFSWFENSFCQSKWSKKKGKQANVSLRPIVGSKKAEKSHRQLCRLYAHMSKGSFTHVTWRFLWRGPIRSQKNWSGKSDQARLKRALDSFHPA